MTSPGLPHVFHVYVAVLTGTAATAVGVTVSRGDDLLAHPLMFVALTALLVLVEATDLSYYDDKIRWGLSAAEAVLLPMLVVLSLGQVVISAAVAVGLARGRSWSKSPSKEMFNVAQYACAAAAAAALWQWLADDSGAFSIRNAAVAAAAVMLVALLTHLFVAIGLALARVGSFVDAVHDVGPVALLNLAGNITLGLFFAASYIAAPWTTLLFPIPLMALYFGFRAVVGQRGERQRVERLHAASQALAGAPDLSSALTGFLKAVAEMGSAQSARILLRSDTGYVWSGFEGGAEMASLEPIDQGPLVSLLEELTRDPTPLVSGSGGDGQERLVSALIGNNLIGVPIIVEDETIGCLTVQGRVGADEFGDADARLLEALANEVALAIESRRSHEQRIQAEEEKETLQNQLHQAQKLETVGRLAGGIAHDFNNLLSVMLNYSRFVEESVVDNPEVLDDVREIKSAAERAAALTRQLLIFSRREIPAPQIVDLNDVVAGVERLLRRSIGEDIALTVQLEPNLRPVRIDTGQMEQVLLNLAINARDAMEGGGSLTIDTAGVTITEDSAKKTVGLPPGNYIRLRVTDTGTGMTQAVQDRVFEPFFTTKPKEVGTGLGLATVYGIVQQSKGHISVDSKIGMGTSFVIHLPASEEPVTPSVKAGETPQEGRGERVLLVEDQDAVRAVASRILKTNGYEVVEAKNGHDALRVVESGTEPVQLLLSDVIMPKMSGLELGDRIAQTNPQLRILYMSGYSEALRSNGTDLDDGVKLLQKPFTQNELLTKVREVLDA